MARGRSWVWVVCLLVLAWTMPARAVVGPVVSYQAINLADPVPGQDLWQYQYTIQGSFDTFEEIRILFDPARYTALAEQLPYVPDWLTFVTQPSPPATNGEYSAYTGFLMSGSFGPFILNFRWLGPGQPGAQTFEYYNAGLVFVNGGSTQPIPEPETYALFSAGVVFVAYAVRRRKFVPR